MDAFSSPRNRNITLILLAVCILLGVTAALIGIDDNLPGALLALFSGVAFVLAFVHPWRITRNFLFLLLAAVLGSVLFITVNILIDTTTQNSDRAGIPNALQNTILDIASTIFIMVCLAAFLIGVVGSIVMFIRNRRKTA